MAIVFVAGAVANRPLKAGEAWHRLSWVLGLRRLGFDVYLVEQLSPENCFDASGSRVGFAESVNLAYFRNVVEAFGLLGAAVLIYREGDETWGLKYSDMLEVASTAELLVNISGHLTLEPILQRVRRKVYIDEDPGFTQFWTAGDRSKLGLERHDFHFTIGENIGSAACSIPAGGTHWRPTRPIVVLDEWPVSQSNERERFTTIAGWRGPFGPVQFDGKTYGLKVHEFRKFIELPARSRLTYELALDIDPADHRDLKLLREHGWRVVDPRVAVPDPGSFRRYIQLSGGEFSVAKGIYVETNSGWFSDRTVRYLASGKPVLIQETGFSRNIPTGEGLVAFRTLEEAVEGAERIASDYEAHCHAARAIAEEFFDSDKVLGRLLEEIGVSP